MNIYIDQRLLKYSAPPAPPSTTPGGAPFNDANAYLLRPPPPLWNVINLLSRVESTVSEVLRQRSGGE